MGMTVKKVTDPAFKAYGRVITGYDFSGLLKAMEQTPLPEDVIYIPSLPEMEALPAAKELENGIYGQMPIQIGCCNGHNKKLNAVEYHRDSEVDIAVDDLILILGKQQDIEEDHTYDTSRMEAFLVPAGTAVEVYATTLHYAPCHVKDEGFRCVIVLPRPRSPSRSLARASPSCAITSTPRASSWATRGRCFWALRWAPSRCST